MVKYNEQATVSSDAAAHGRDEARRAFRPAMTLGLTAIALLAVGTLGSLLPALRASRIEPTEALRSQ